MSRRYFFPMGRPLSLQAIRRGVSRLALRSGAALLVSAGSVACGTTTNGDTIDLGEIAPSALDDAREAVRQKPNDARALARLGAILVSEGAPLSPEMSEGARLLGRAASIAPNEPEIARWQGRALLGSGRAVEAQRAFGRALDADPEFRDRYESEFEPAIVAALDARLQRDKRASKDLSDAAARLSTGAVKRAPEAAAALYEAVGDFRAGAGRSADAIVAFERARAARDAANRASPELGLKHARALLAVRRLDDARVQLDAWIADGPAEELTARRRRAAALCEERFAFELADDFLRAATPTGDQADHTLTLARARVLFKAKKTDEATALLKSLLATAPDASVLSEVGALAVTFGAPALAADAFVAAVAANPNDVGLWKVAARALVTAGDRSKLEARLGLPASHAAWAEVYLELNEPEKAVSALEAARKDGQDVSLRLARALHLTGDPKRRDEVVADFVKRAPARGKALAEAASFYDGIGDAARALVTFRDAVSESPTDGVLALGYAKQLRAARDFAGEKKVLETWASNASSADARVRAWVEVAAYWSRERKGPEAAAALDQALAQGDVPSRRAALLAAAEVHHQLVRDAARAEQLYRNWIDAAPDAERDDARRTVIDKLQTEAPVGTPAVGPRDPSFQRLRTRLLEELVSSPNSDSALLLELGEAYLELRPPQREAAERTFGRYVDSAPDRQAALIRVGNRLEEANAFAEAARTYARLEPGELSSAEDRLSVAMVLLRTQDWRRAQSFLAAYLDAVEKPPASARDPLFRAAAQFLNAGAPEFSVRLYRVLLRIDPNKTAVLRPLGDALLATGDVGGAEEVLRAYIDASGGSFNAVVSAGDAFRQRRAYAKAREVYESVFDARSRTRLSRLFPVLFETYARLNDLDSMRKLALEYVKLTPNPRAYADAARRLRDAGLLRDAYDLYGQAISAQPGSSAFREQRMAIAFQMGDASAVETASRDYVASERTEGAWVKVASLHANRGDTTSARRVLEDARKAGIDGAELQLELGRLALADAARAAATDSGAASARPSQEAIVSAFSAALAFPDSVDAVLPKIRKLLSDAGELGALSAVLREVIALYPTRHETWFELGDIAAARGRLEEARSLWERFTERDSRGAFLVAGRLWREGDASSARRYFERALDNPTVENPADVLESLVSVLLTMGQNDRVPPLLTRVTSSAGGVADLSKIAPMLESAGFVDEAARAYEELLEQRPVAEGWYRLGLLRLLLDQDAAARAAFERFLEAEPGQRERAVSSDRGKRALLRLQRLVGVTAALDAAGLEDMALEFMRREEAALPELAAVHLLSARLRLATGDISGGMASIGAMLDAPVQAGLDEGTVGALLDQIAALGRSPEALEVFRVSASERQGSAGLALAVASLAIRSGDTGAAQAELRKLIAEPSGEARFRAGRLLLEAGLDSEASEVWLSGLDAGQGLSAVDGLLRAVFGLALRNGDDGLVNDAERRVRELVEETREYHRIVALAFSSSGHYARAAEAAAAWVGALSDVPPADGLLAADPPHPMRVLIEAHLKAGNPNAAISAIDEWASESSAPAAVFTASAALLIEALHPEAAAQVLDRAMALEPASMTLRVSRLEALLDADVAASDTPAGPIATAANQITARYPDLSATTARIADGLSSRAFVQTATAVRDASSLPLSLDHLSALVDDTCSRGGDCGTWSPETTKRWEADAARFVRESPDGAFASVQLCALALGRAHFPSAMLERLAADANAKRPDAPHPVALLAGAVASLARGDDTAALASLDTVLDLGGVELPAVLDPRRRASGPHSARTLAAGLFMARAVGSGRFEAAHRALERAVKSAGTIDGRLAAADAVRDALERYPGTPATESRRLAAAALALVDPLRLRGAQYVALTSLVSDLWEKQSDLPTAEFVYRQALERFPASPALHNNLAYFLARHGEKLEDALSLVRRAHALAPERTLAYVDTEAWILHRLGRNGDAKVLLEEALRLATKQDGSGLSEGYYHLGVVEDALGNADESVRALKLAIRYDRGGQFGRSAAALLEKKGK